MERFGEYWKAGFKEIGRRTTTKGQEKWGLPSLQPIRALKRCNRLSKTFRGDLMNARTGFLVFGQLVLATPFFVLVIAALFLVVGGNLAGAASAIPAACHHPLRTV